MRLTDMSIKALKAPATGAVIYPDAVVPGFGVRVSQAGTKSFVLTHGIRRQRETIGRVGVVGLQDARGEAKRRLAEYTLGKHRPRSTGWSAALEEYLAEIALKRKVRTHEDYKRILEKHFKFGETKLSDLTSHDLTGKLDKLKKTPAEHQHAFVVLRAFVRWAHQRHYLDGNPMERMKAPHRYQPRERVLTTSELGKVWNAAGMDTYGRIVKLLILTGQRVGEIKSLTRKMMTADTVTLPSALTKNSREHTFPIGPMSLALLPGHEGYLFPARGTRATKPFNGFSKSKTALDERSGVEAWTLHDLRRTFASGLASLGVTLPVIEKLLNHVSGSFGGIVGVYQKYDFMPEMRAAVVKWERHLSHLTKAATLASP